MTQGELDDLIKDLHRLAQQVGVRFVPDQRKMKALLQKR